jgi:hypothetical protein
LADAAKGQVNTSEIRRFITTPHSTFLQIVVCH